MTHPLADALKAIGDLLSIGVVLGTLASWLPPVAAFLTIVWTAIRIYETKSVQRLLKRDGGG